MDTVRLDKFLWAVRIFKTRSQAAEACSGNKITRLQQKLKPASSVKTGDILEVQKLPYPLTIQVLQVLDKRVAASLVEEYIKDLTPPQRKEEALERRLQNPRRDRGTGRPTKRERREIDIMLKHLP